MHAQSSSVLHELRRAHEAERDLAIKYRTHDAPGESPAETPTRFHSRAGAALQRLGNLLHRPLAPQPLKPSRS